MIAASLNIASVFRAITQYRRAWALAWTLSRSHSYGSKEGQAQAWLDKLAPKQVAGR